MEMTKEFKEKLIRALKFAHCDGKEGFEFKAEDYFIHFED